MTEIIIGESDDFEGTDTTINTSNLTLEKQQQSESHVPAVNCSIIWLKMLFVLPVVFVIVVSSFIRDRFDKINDYNYHANILPCTTDCMKIVNSMAILIFPLSNLVRYDWRTATAAINMILFIIFSNNMTLSFILYICWMLFSMIVSEYMAHEVSTSTNKSFWYLSVINGVVGFIWSCFRFQIVPHSSWYVCLDYIIWSLLGVLFISKFNLEGYLHSVAFNGPISSYLEKKGNPHHVRDRKFIIFFVSCYAISFVFWIKYSWLLLYKIYR
eukprot:544656_1